MTDQEFDERLVKVLVQAASEEAEKLEREEVPDWTPSPAYLRWEERFLGLKKRRRRRMRWLRNAACLLLTAVVGAAALLGMNPTVRADFIQWVKEISPTRVHYQFCGESRTEELPVCRLSWLPEGYAELEYELDTEARIALVTYCNHAEQLIHLHYLSIQDGTALVMNTEGQTCTSVRVNGSEGELYLSETEDRVNELTWADEEAGLFFSLSGYVTEEELLKMAESLTIEAYEE